ncbi:MAG: arsenite efflux transporter metallochaperone ArsD [Candidatus Coproplasma sp.]
MKTMEIFEPAMCCSTGLCGVSIDPELLRVSTNLNSLKAHGIIINRYNLSSAPAAFVSNAAVNQELHENGGDNLPLILVDGKIVIKKRYPTDEEFCELLEIPCEYLSSDKGCCGGNKSTGSGCCGGNTGCC